MPPFRISSLCNSSTGWVIQYVPMRWTRRGYVQIGRETFADIISARAVITEAANA